MKHLSDDEYIHILDVIMFKGIKALEDDENIEVKKDFNAMKSGNVFVEYEYDGRPSGLATSIVDFYCFVVSEGQYLIIELNELKKKCRKYLNTRRDVLSSVNNKKRGIILPIKELLS